MTKKAVDGRLTKSTSEVDSQGSLTLLEKEILNLLTVEFLTVKQICRRRKCTKQAVSKIVTKLKQKGLLSGVFGRVDNGVSTRQPSQPPARPANKVRQIRLHGEEWNIRVLFNNKGYGEVLARANNLIIDNNTVRLHRSSVEVYSGQSFFGEDVNHVTAKSVEYWNRFFVRLENDLKVTLIKARNQNIRRVNAHYAEINNEFARECELEDTRIKIHTTDDGKLWFLVDNSFNLHEAETVHSQTSQGDMADVVAPFFNDLRDNRPPVPSEVWAVLGEVARHEKELAAGLNSVVTLLKVQMGVGDSGLVPEGRPDYFG